MMDVLGFLKAKPTTSVKGARASIDQAQEFLALSKKIAQELEEAADLPEEQRALMVQQAKDYAIQAGRLANLAKSLVR